MIAAPPIDDIVQTIVDAVHPRRVVLFGSHVRGDARPDSDVDLMVEMDVEPDRRQREEAIRSLWRASAWDVDPKVYDSASVERWRDDPGHLLYAIVREGREVYARPGEPPAPPKRVREAPERPESLESWINKANTDLAVVAALTTTAAVLWEPVCFHAQQAAEKYLKALLILRRTQPVRTHDLSKLLAACRTAGFALEGLDEACRTLTPFASDTRYSGDVTLRPAPTPAEGQAAVAACHRIVVAARRCLGNVTA